MFKELQFLIYSTPQKDIKVDVAVKDDTIWLTQKAMAVLFDVQVPAIHKHLKNIFEEGELDEKVVISKMEITTVEIIYAKADKNKEYMGLTVWKNSPDGRILKSDVTVAKNYLSEVEIRRLERTVTGYFDYIEDLIEQENTFTMKEFTLRVNEFLAFRKYRILTDKGNISKEEADKKAEAEYEEFNKTQKIISDFDKDIKNTLKKYIPHC